MELRIYQCKSCGTLVAVPEEEERPPKSCPLCRGNLVLLDSSIDESMKQYECPNCEFKFMMSGHLSPYKCPYCNFTLASSPYRKYEEKF